MNKFNKTNQCGLDWPADSECKPFLMVLKSHLIQINLPQFQTKSLYSGIEFWKKKKFHHIPIKTCPQHLKQVIYISNSFIHMYLRLSSDLSLCCFTLPKFRQLISLPPPSFLCFSFACLCIFFPSRFKPLNFFLPLIGGPIRNH